ncbi:sterol carrier family protein [Phytoactinopolyspora halotolerans]|uniref:Maleylpyruvate isomerase family protein n=1 Tax=Phytoactinopolyspora halotolerans TaxID=1981512 RepID=A0A6L9S4H3_9ACTN|nr:sterol carrier family protein [Phytoactinopolyspora halotolerans]NED99407.1 maleylpyruvate isomerase family protein [Phytoactinopolyspora halotolerans]
MAKRSDPSKAWDMYAEGHAALRRWLGRIPDEHWQCASVLPGWTIADLAAHIAMVGDSIVALVEARPRVVAKSIAGYISGYAQAANTISEGTRDIAADAGQKPQEILAAVDERFERAGEHVRRLGLGDQVVEARRGPIRLGDFLLTRVIELVVHADDFARSLADLDAPVMPQGVQRTAVRTLLDVLVERAPGRTVEVRVPPHAAVQCIAGPRHTRGTPPNVVEMDATTWIRLAAGRTTWAGEVAEAHVSASGDRADLSAHLPVL